MSIFYYILAVFLISSRLGTVCDTAGFSVRAARGLLKLVSGGAIGFCAGGGVDLVCAGGGVDLACDGGGFGLVCVGGGVDLACGG